MKEELTTEKQKATTSTLDVNMPMKPSRLQIPPDLRTRIYLGGFLILVVCCSFYLISEAFSSDPEIPDKPKPVVEKETVPLFNQLRFGINADGDSFYDFDLTTNNRTNETYFKISEKGIRKEIHVESGVGCVSLLYKVKDATETEEKVKMSTIKTLDGEQKCSKTGRKGILFNMTQRETITFAEDECEGRSQCQKLCHKEYNGVFKYVTKPEKAYQCTVNATIETLCFLVDTKDPKSVRIHSGCYEDGKNYTRYSTDPAKKSSFKVLLKPYDGISIEEPKVHEAPSKPSPKETAPPVPIPHNTQDEATDMDALLLGLAISTICLLGCGGLALAIRSRHATGKKLDKIELDSSKRAIKKDDGDHEDLEDDHVEFDDRRPTFVH
jgi:hypothetical protein